MNSNEKIPTSRIEKDSYYSASRIIKNEWFPWIQSSMTFLQMLKTEKKAMKMYKPIIRKKGLQTRYYIKGETILDIIKLSEQGRLEI